MPSEVPLRRTISCLEYSHIFFVDTKVHNALLMQWRDFWRPSVKKDCEARALVYRQRGGAVDHDGTISSGHFVQFDGHQWRPSVQAYATFKIVDYSPCPGCDRISTSEAIEPTFAHVAEWLCYHALIDTTFVMTLNTSWLFFKCDVSGHELSGSIWSDRIIRPYINWFVQEPDMWISQGKEVFWALREHGFFVFSRRHGSGADDEPGEYQIWPSIYDTDWPDHQKRPFVDEPPRRRRRILSRVPEYCRGNVLIIGLRG